MHFTTIIHHLQTLGPKFRHVYSSHYTLVKINIFNDTSIIKTAPVQKGVSNCLRTPPFSCVQLWTEAVLKSCTTRPHCALRHE